MLVFRRGWKMAEKISIKRRGANRPGRKKSAAIAKWRMARKATKI